MLTKLLKNVCTLIAIWHFPIFIDPSRTYP